MLSVYLACWYQYEAARRLPPASSHQPQVSSLQSRSSCPPLIVAYRSHLDKLIVLRIASHGVVWYGLVWPGLLLIWLLPLARWGWQRSVSGASCGSSHPSIAWMGRHLVLCSSYSYNYSFVCCRFALNYVCCSCCSCFSSIRLSISWTDSIYDLRGTLRGICFVLYIHFHCLSLFRLLSILISVSASHFVAMPTVYVCKCGLSLSLRMCVCLMSLCADRGQR